MRTPKQIAERIKTVAPEDVLGFEQEILIAYLPYEEASPYLTADTTKIKWDEVRSKPEKKAIKAEAKDYMKFALGKCVDHRGLSAGRSVSKLRAFMWLLNNEEKIDWDNYENYGAPILKEICDLMGWQSLYETMDDYDRKAFLRMAEGKVCQPDGCPEMGCGRGWG